MIVIQSRKIISEKTVVLGICLVVFCLFLATGCAPTRPLFPDVLQPNETSLLAEKLSDSRAVCIGEVHTVAMHHKNQLKLIQGIHDNGVDVAIGLEMFSFTSQPILDAWIDGSLSLKDFTKGYYQNWKIPFGMYKDIFLYAKKESIPLLGLNVPKSIAGKMARQGYYSLTAREKEILPNNIFCKPESPSMILLRSVLTAHGDSGVLFQRYCEAHMLRDKTMALYAGNYLELNPGKTLVVLAGIGHCVKQGTPDYLEEILKERTIVILPAVSEQVLKQSITYKNADYLLEE